MKVTAIVPAAGKGIRLNSKLSKPWVKVSSRPILIHTLRALNGHPLISEVILVVNPDDLCVVKNKMKAYHLNKIKKIIGGGATRKDSVKKGLDELTKDTDLVFIHDGVRPFIDKNTITRVIVEAERFSAAVVGVPVKATIKKVSTESSLLNLQDRSLQDISALTISETLNRDELWEIQTPQVFRKEIICEAYDKFGNLEASDDASLVERLGVKVRLIFGSYFNIKITTPEDLILAKAIYKIQKSKINPSTTLRIDGERSRTIKIQKSKLKNFYFDI